MEDNIVNKKEEEFKFYSYNKILDFLGIKYDFQNENNKDYPYNRNIEDIDFMYGYIVIPRYGIEKIVQNKISDIKEEVLDKITMLVQLPFAHKGKPRSNSY